ncbi:hypothetical protein F4777DRAFT_585098 [Nemania sp. FL0916]|nr:hypothetical protein F4777DRAFT_585098 [Nemania sp. FL0916]
MRFTINTISYCGKQLFIINIVFTVICIFFLVLRFWSAHLSRRKLRWDDFFAVLAFLAKGGLSVAGFWGTFNGLGAHISALTPDQLTVQVKILLISEFTYLLGTASVKFSMLFLYYRIYTTPAFKRWCWVVIILNAIYLSKSAIWAPNPRHLDVLANPIQAYKRLLISWATVSFIPVFLTGCVPLSQYWDPKPGGWCRNTLIGDNATVAANLILDVFVLALPLPVLWRLQMSLRDKLTVTAMFGFGAVTIGLVLWRLVVTQKTRSGSDWTETLCEVGLIASLEVFLGIIAVCVPTLGPLFNAYMRPMLKKLGLTKTTHAGSSGANKIYLETIGGSNSNKPSKHAYSEFADSVDRIVSRDESLNFAPRGEGKVTAECTYKAKDDPRVSDRDGDGIHVQSDIEAIYHHRKGTYYDE